MPAWACPSPNPAVYAAATMVNPSARFNPRLPNYHVVFSAGCACKLVFGLTQHGAIKSLHVWISRHHPRDLVVSENLNLLIYRPFLLMNKLHVNRSASSSSLVGETILKGEGRFPAIHALFSEKKIRYFANKCKHFRTTLDLSEQTHYLPPY